MYSFYIKVFSACVVVCDVNLCMCYGHVHAASNTSMTPDQQKLINCMCSNNLLESSQQATIAPSTCTTLSRQVVM